MLYVFVCVGSFCFWGGDLISVSFLGVAARYVCFLYGCDVYFADAYLLRDAILRLSIYEAFGIYRGYL